MTETEIRDKLIDKLKDIVGPPYLIETEVPIPYKHIYIPADDKNKVEIWCFKQDIVIYKKLFDKTVKQSESKITKGTETIIDVILEKDSGQNSHHVGLPFVIIELKREQPNTHEILTYSQKAEMIKTIFPYCQFLFLIYGTIAARTYRHGINFDEIISLTNIDDKNEIKRLRETILKHFDIATTSLTTLTGRNKKEKKEKKIE